MGDSGVASLMHRLAQPSQDGLVVHCQNVSFADKSIHTLLLHGWCPSWTGLSISFMECVPLGKSLGTQVLLRPFNKTTYHSPGCPTVLFGQSPSSQHNNIH